MNEDENSALPVELGVDAVVDNVLLNVAIGEYAGRTSSKIQTATNSDGGRG